MLLTGDISDITSRTAIITLSKKRIHNLNKDSYEYVKDDFEPIITEEQWDRCQDILKEKRNFGYFNDFLRF